MTDLHREHLSAAADGQLGEEQLRFLLRRMEHDAELLATWGRYHLAGDSLRQQLPTLAPAGFAARVSRAVDQLDAAQVGGRHLSRWLRWSAGGAIAAGVAVAALMVAQPSGDGPQPATELAADAGSPAPGVATAAAATPPAVNPAAVPPWLSAASASAYSQQAAATFGGASSGDIVLPYGRGSLAPYQLQSIRAQGPGNGYLLRVDPQSGQVVRPPQRATAIQ